MLNQRLHENKRKRWLAQLLRPLIKTISPTLYVKLQYRYITHHKLNLTNPVRYTEKLQYLRLYVFPKDPLVIKCAGRAGVRDYVKEKGYENILIPLYGIYDSFEDIDFGGLPHSFVMKCAHASGYNLIVPEKNKMNYETAKQQFDKWLLTDYGAETCERHYSGIKPQIVIEKYLGDGATLPIEYKLHVFNGKAKYFYVVTGRGSDIRYNNYYIDWTPFEAAQFNGWVKADQSPAKPESFGEMIKIAEILAKPFPFVRVDFYDINGKIYFGEMTFTPAKGTLIFDGDQADFEIGSWLNINDYL
jgi:hypothetical protein